MLNTQVTEAKEANCVQRKDFEGFLELSKVFLITKGPKITCV